MQPMNATQQRFLWRAAVLALVLGAGVGAGFLARSGEVSDLSADVKRISAQLSESRSAQQRVAASADSAIAARDDAIEAQEYAEAQLELARTATSGAGSRDAAQVLAVLASIDPYLASNEDRALGRAENICADIEAGKPDETIVENTQARFEGGTVPEISTDDAARIVAAVRDSYC